MQASRPTPRRRKAPVQPGARYKRLLAYRDRALHRIMAAEKSLAAIDKEIARLERRFKDQTGEWQKERAAIKAGRNAAIKQRKQELAAVKAYAALTKADGVYILCNDREVQAGWHLGISSGIIYLFGKGWFRAEWIGMGGNGWGLTTPFGRPDLLNKEAAE